MSNATAAIIFYCHQPSCDRRRGAYCQGLLTATGPGGRLKR